MSDIDNFRDAMQAAGIEPPEHIEPDGKLHRFSTNGKSHDTAGWYVLHLDGIPAGAFGCWRADIRENWSSRASDTLSPDEQKAHKERIKEIEAARIAEERKRHQEAAVRAGEMLGHAGTPDSNHHYLVTKGIQPFDIRQKGEELLISLQDAEGAIGSLQRINGKGEKRFLTGGRKKSLFHLLGEMNTTGPLLVCEGFATGASLHQASALPVAVAFDAGNLRPVALALWEKWPGLRLVFAADDDVNSDINIGREKAQEAADATGGYVVLPDFGPDRPEGVSDFNDLHALRGLEEVACQIRPVVEDMSAVPWDGVPIPLGYLLSSRGVFEQGGRDKRRLSACPAWVAALSRNAKSEEWGRLICWVDQDGREHKQPVPAPWFHRQRSDELVELLASGGLHIEPGLEKVLLRYLAAFAPEARLLAASRTGWHSSAFVLPDQVLLEPLNERIVFQPEGYIASADAVHEAGSFVAWKEMVQGVSAPVKFAIAAALAAPLLHPASIQAGGFHFYGVTSRGKTTLLQAAASVWGNGADPGMAGGASAYLQRWNATSNGLEGMAAGFNDMPLIVDEIGEHDGHDFGRLIYQLMSGTGKSRANRIGGLRRRHAWRVLLLSAGEVPVADYIEGGARGGQLVRLVDLRAEELFPDAEAVDALKRGCARHFGHAGPAFINSGDLVEGWSSKDSARVGPSPTPEAGRVRERFHLIAHAGELAIRRGILPWRQGEVLAAAQGLYMQWLMDENPPDDATRGVENVRAFILGNPTRFEKPEDTRDASNRAGWARDGMHHFLPVAFREACRGVDSVTVKKELKRLGLLHTNRPGKLGATVKVNNKSVTVVSVRDQILETPVFGSAGGVGGAQPCAVGLSADAPTEADGAPGAPGDKSEMALMATCGAPDAPVMNPGASPETRATQGWTPPTPPAPLEIYNPENPDGSDACSAADSCLWRAKL